MRFPFNQSTFIVQIVLVTRVISVLNNTLLLLDSLNTSQVESNNKTPFEMMFGRKANIYPIINVESTSDTSIVPASSIEIQSNDVTGMDSEEYDMIEINTGKMILLCTVNDICGGVYLHLQLYGEHIVEHLVSFSNITLRSKTKLQYYFKYTLF